MKKLSSHATAAKLTLGKKTLKRLHVQTNIQTGRITGASECQATCLVKTCGDSARCTHPC